MQPLTAVHVRTMCFVAPILLAGSVFAAQANTVASSSAISGDNVPAFVTRAKDLGRVAPDTDMRVTVWLKTRNDADFDKAVDQIYSPGSKTYHQWMTAADLAKYAPAASDVQTVRTELEAHGLTVSVDPSGLALIAHGPVANVETALQTQIRNYSLNGRTLQANSETAALRGNVGNLVASISGLSSSVMRPMLLRQRDPDTGAAMGPKPLGKAPFASGISAFVTDQCFKAPTAYEFTVSSKRSAAYFGNVYDQGSDLICGYTPAKLAAIYGVDVAVKQGLKGQGQTIVIVDAFGSPNILADANLFSSLAGLPPLNSSNFEVIYPGGMPVINVASKNQEGWAEEVSLDVEWAHAMAPKARIVLLAALSDKDQDLEYAIHYATVNHLGDVMSNSYGGTEEESSTALLRSYNKLIKRAAALGIAVNVASGDDGDNVDLDGVVTASSPSDSPYATSVGGTSLNVPSDGGLTTTGWGNNLTRISKVAGIHDPPVFLGFVGGSGGGESSVFDKPTYQKSLPGSSRQQPDVSAIGDPYTGVPVIFTQLSDNFPSVAVFGGTSVSTPVFSAIWALADQLAGKSLGQAAPIVAQLSSSALLDVVPVKSSTNVLGAITDKNGTTVYSPVDLVPPVSEPKFVSALDPIYTGDPAPSRFDVVSFGTDSSLRIEKGWDNVTGYGTPAGFSFISEAAEYK